MKLIINADDFGLSKSITDGIVSGIIGGGITSTSIMANMPFAQYAIDEAVKFGINCIGLHVNLTVGKPLIKNPNLTDDNGVFYYNKAQINNEKLTYEDAYNEIMAQFNFVQEKSKGKIQIDHLDTHHHLRDNEKIRQAINDICKKFNLPIRKDKKDSDLKSPDYLFHDFTIENVNIETLKCFVEAYKSTDKIFEIMTHPGYIDDYTRTVTSYLDRDMELAILKEALALGVYEGVRLISYREF
jgi:hypothetical protein